MWVFPKIGVPQNGWFVMENPIKMDDLGYHYFRKHPCGEKFTIPTFRFTLQNNIKIQLIINVGKAMWQGIPWVYLIFMVNIGKYSIHGDIWESYCMSAHRHPTQTIVHWLLIEPNPLKLQFLCQERSRPFWVIFGEKRFKDTMFVIFSMVNLCTNHHVKKTFSAPEEPRKNIAENEGSGRELNLKVIIFRFVELPP